MCRVLSLVFFLMTIADVLGGGADERAKKVEPGYRTPYEAWEAYRYARHEGRWRDAFKCLSPESQERFLAVIVMTYGYISAGSDLATAEVLRVTLSKHGLDGSTVEAAIKQPSSVDQIKELKRHVNDQEGLFHDTMMVLSRSIPKRIGTDGKRLIEYGPLTRLSIEGDKGSGEFVKVLDEKTVSEGGGVRDAERKVSVEFRKIGSRWFCVMAGGY